MTETNQSGNTPDFKADGVAVWENQTKDGKPYLSIKIIGLNKINAFKTERKELKKEEPLGSTLSKNQLTAYNSFIKIGLPHDKALKNALDIE